VADQTHDLIQDLFAPAAITSDTALVLANAIYFKGSWEYAFDADLTKDSDFTLLSGDTVQVAMMSLLGEELAYTTIEGAQIVELPYRGGDLAMDLIVPDDPAGLAAVESALDGETFGAAMADHPYLFVIRDLLTGSVLFVGRIEDPS
jgi:serpin B